MDRPLHRPLYRPQDSGGLLPETLRLPTYNILAQYRTSNVLGTRYIDKGGSGTHEVLPGAFTVFNGTVYGKLVDANGTDTSITLSGDFKVSIYIVQGDLSADRVILGGVTTAAGILGYFSTSTVGVLRVYIASSSYIFNQIVITQGSQGLLTFERVGSYLTVSFNGTSQTITVSTSDVILYRVGAWGSGNYLNGNLWNIHIEDSTGVIFSNPLAQNTTSMLMKSQVGPDVQFVNGTYPIVGTSNKYGHTWENYSEVENLLKWSEGFSDPVWVLTSCTITPGFLAPDGSLSAYKVVFASDTQARVQQSLPGLTTGQSYTYSIYARVLTGTRTCRFGTSTSTPGEFTDIVLTDTWQSFTITAPASDSEEYPRIQAGSAGAGEIYVWGFSATKGSTLKPYIKTTTQPISLSKVPASLTDTSKDIFGNALTHPGTPRKNMKVYGYTGTWDGVAYGAISPIATSENLKIETAFTVSSLATIVGILGTDALGDFLRILATGYIQFRVGGTGPITANLQVLVGTRYKLTVVRTGTSVTFTLNGVSETLTTGTGSFDVDRFCSAVLAPMKGSLEYLKLYDNDTLIHHWICESSNTSLQDKIYDIVGGNHATLTNATLPFFTTQKEGSQLLAGGFQYGENLLKYSEDFSNVAWQVSGSAVCTSNTAIAPDGTLTADTLSIPTTGFVYQDISLSKVKAIASCYIKGTAGETLKIEARAANSSVATQKLFTLTGEWQRVDNKDIAADWSLQTDSTVRFTIRKDAVNTASTVYVWGAQVNKDTIRDYTKTTTTAIPLSCIPTNPSTNLSALGQSLTHQPGKLKADTPVLLEMLPCVDGWEADESLNTFYNTDGTVKKVSPGTIDAWTDGHVNQQYYWSLSRGIIALYKDPQEATNHNKTLKFL